MKERIYIVPLRDAWNATYKKRSKRAVSIIIEFMRKHMKNEDVKIGQYLNKHIWERGIKNPPRKVKVRALEYNDEIWVELFDKKFPFEEKQAEVKKESAEKVSEKKEAKGKETSGKETKAKESGKKKTEKKEKNASDKKGEKGSKKKEDVKKESKSSKGTDSKEKAEKKE